MRGRWFSREGTRDRKGQGNERDRGMKSTREGTRGWERTGEWKGTRGKTRGSSSRHGSSKDTVEISFHFSKKSPCGGYSLIDIIFIVERHEENRLRDLKKTG